MREVLTYSRRGSRFSPRQQQAWDAHAGEWWIPDDAVDEPGFSWERWFGREAPKIVEIGSGVGEATAALAATRPAYDVLAFEVWRPGVADGLARVAEAGSTNVRFCSVDAVWSMEELIDPASLSELWTFFPDPWHKTRHHKRRLVTRDFARVAAAGWLRGDLAAGHGLGRLRRADGRGARRRARPDRRGRSALGGAAGHEVRAQGRGRGPRDHGPGLHPALNGAVSWPQATSSRCIPQMFSTRSTRTRSTSSSSPGPEDAEQVGHAERVTALAQHPVVGVAHGLGLGVRDAVPGEPVTLSSSSGVGGDQLDRAAYRSRWLDGRTPGRPGCSSGSDHGAGRTPRRRRRTAGINRIRSSRTMMITAVPSLSVQPMLSR